VAGISTRERDGSLQANAVGISAVAVLLAAVADLAFTGAVAVHVAFYNVVGWTVGLVIASALLFIASTIAALASKRKAVVIASVALVAVAGLGAVTSAVVNGLHYQSVRREAFRTATGLPVAGPSADATRDRRLAGAMLSSVSASLAAITALPLAAYLAYRILPADDEP
jgi:hypothetical protein